MCACGWERRSIHTLQRLLSWPHILLTQHTRTRRNERQREKGRRGGEGGKAGPILPTHNQLDSRTQFTRLCSLPTPTDTSPTHIYTHTHIHLHTQRHTCTVYRGGGTLRQGREHTHTKLRPVSLTPFPSHHTPTHRIFLSPTVFRSENSPKSTVSAAPNRRRGLQTPQTPRRRCQLYVRPSHLPFCDDFRTIRCTDVSFSEMSGCASMSAWCSGSFCVDTVSGWTGMRGRRTQTLKT